MKNKILLLLILFTFIHLATLHAQAVDDPRDTATWMVNPSDYPLQSSMILTISLHIRGEETQNSKDKIAAFIGNTCRGMGRPKYVQSLDRYLISLFVYGEEVDRGEMITFWVYDQNNDRVLEVKDKEEFAPDSFLGSLSNPLVISAESFYTTITSRNLNCSTDQLAFAYADVEGGTGPYTYQWSNGGNTAQVSNLQEGWYYLTVTDREGEAITDSVEILNLAQPIIPPVLSVFPGDTVCGGEDVFILSEAEEGAITEWYDEEGAVLSRSPWLNLVEVGVERQITARSDLYGCLSEPVIVTVAVKGPNADFGINPDNEVEQAGVVQFHPAALSNDYSYYWQFGDNGWSTQREPYYFYNLLGSFDVSLQVTDEEGCTTMEVKEAFVEVVPALSGLRTAEDISATEEISTLAATIFPNPFQEEIVLIVKVSIPDQYSVRIMDLFGRTLYQQEWLLQEGVHQQVIYAGEYLRAEGMYVLEVTGNNQKKAFKLFRKN
jgi:hypothetical protein